MNGITVVEAAIKNAVEKYAQSLQEELMAKYTKEFERKLESKRIEITAHVVGSMSVHEDVNKMQIVIALK